MAAVISAIVYTFKDGGGNLRTEGWFVWEYRESYVAGGIQADLSNYFRRVESISAEPSSGVGVEIVVPNEADLPNQTGASARIQVFRQGGSGAALSEITTLAISGTRARLHVLGY